MVKDKRVLVENIRAMIENPLCTGCGGCAGICPNNAIDLKVNRWGTYTPTFNEKKCIYCGLCVEICPVNNIQIRSHINTTVSMYRGGKYYIKAYMGYSTDFNLRKNGASGGAITEILVYLLKNNIVDGVVIPQLSNNSPYTYIPKIITEIEEVKNQKGSKYVPIPMAYSLKEILKFKGVLAFVGIPCHIWTIKKAMDKFPILRKKIKITIGPVCGQTPTFYATKYLLNKLNISEDDVEKIYFRGEGWPGQFKIQLKNKKEIKIPYESSLGMGTLYSSIAYTPFYCNFCLDPLNIFTDISVGDAWFLKFENKMDIADGGVSLIMTHTKVGEEIIELLNSSGHLYTEEVSYESVVKSYKDPLNKRRLAECLLSQYLGFNKDIIIGKCSIGEKLRSLLYFGVIKYFHNMNIDKFNNAVPMWVLEILKIFNKI